jgi:hypothetical protein
VLVQDFATGEGNPELTPGSRTRFLPLRRTVGWA